MPTTGLSEADDSLTGWLTAILEGKALGTHQSPNTPLRKKLSVGAKKFFKSDYAKSVNVTHQRDLERQFNAMQAKFKADLRKLYLGWEKSGNIEAFLAKSSKIFRDHYTKVFKLGMTASDLSRHTRPAQRSVRQPTLFTGSDQKWIDSAVKEELGYWKRFLTDLRRGRARQDPFTRINWYVKSAEAPFHAGKVVALPHLQAVRWVYSPIVERHCSGCLRLASLGPYTKESLPCTPRDGSTRCRFNCKCRLEFYEVDKATYLKLSAKPKKSILAQIKGM